MRGLHTLRPLDGLLPLLAIVLLWPILARYERPVQERDFGSLRDGSADFACYYLGSLALVRGFDPYLNGRPEFRDPLGREIQIRGVAVSHFYLPGHYMAFAPLAWLYGNDWEEAAQVYFRLHLILLVILAWIVAAGVWGTTSSGHADNRSRLWRSWALTLSLLGLHVGVRMGLERGQSDVVQSVLFWGGIVCAAQGQIAAAAFLIVAGTSLKGYGLLLVAGLGLSYLGKREFRAFLVGALGAGLPILGLNWPYITTALQVALYKAGDFSFHWTIHSFKHIGWAIAPELADPVRYLMSAMSVVAVVLCWRSFRMAMHTAPDQSTSRLVVAATVSIATMLGFVAGSESYNLVMILPGLAWIAHLMYVGEIPVGEKGEALFAAAFLLIALRTPSRLFAPAAYGLVLLVIWCLLSVRGRGQETIPGHPLRSRSILD